MEDLTLLGTSALTGSLTGIFGSVLSRAFGFFERKQAQQFKLDEWANDEKKRAHALLMADKEHAQVKELHALNEQAARGEHNRAMGLIDQKGSWDGMKAAQAGDIVPAGERGGFVNNTIRMMRPSLTLLYFFAVILVFYVVKEQREYIAAAIVFMWCTAGLYWFGERAKSKDIAAFFGKV